MIVPSIPPATFLCADFFEGNFLKAYRDPLGYWTQGRGHLLTRDKADRSWPDIAEEQSQRWLQSDMLIAARAIAPMIKVCLLPGQYGALVDFAFNLGAMRLRASTLLRLVNDGADQTEILYQLGRWTYGGGKRLKGLQRRRAGEAMVWATGGFDPRQVAAWVPVLDRAPPPQFKVAA